MNRNTKPFNGLGWPALSLPCGVDDLGLPGRPAGGRPRGADDHLLAVAAAIEGALA